MDGEAEAYLTLISIGFLLTIALIMFFFKICKKTYVKSRNVLIKAYANMEELVRDIDITYSPAVVSYLMNQQIEPEKDFLATILNLYAKKIIDIEKIDGKYLIKEGEKSKQQLGEDEEYIYDIIMNDKEIDFNYWLRCIEKEYYKYNFSKNKKYSSHKIVFYIISILIAAILYIKMSGFVGPDFKGRWVWIIFSILASLGASSFISLIMWGICMNVLNIWRNTILTDKGRQEVKKWMKFTKFMEEYSSIEDEPIEAIQIWEKYIPYSISLNINKRYADKGMKLFKNEELYDLKKFKDYNKFGFSFKDF